MTLMVMMMEKMANEEADGGEHCAAEDDVNDAARAENDDHANDTNDGTRSSDAPMLAV